MAQSASVDSYPDLSGVPASAFYSPITYYGASTSGSTAQQPSAATGPLSSIGDFFGTAIGGLESALGISGINTIATGVSAQEQSQDAAPPNYTSLIILGLFLLLAFSFLTKR